MSTMNTKPIPRWLLERENTILRNALSEIHTTAHCISKAGPLHTPTLDVAWGKFDHLGVMATNALWSARRIKGNDFSELETKDVAAPVAAAPSAPSLTATAPAVLPAPKREPETNDFETDDQKAWYRIL